MAKYSIEDTTLTNIADAIRTKTGSSSSIMVQDMASEIAGIKGEPTLQTKTVTPSTSSQTITPDSGYGGLSQVTVNAMPTATQATPSITVSSGGLITAKATQSAGYVESGTKQATKQLTVQAAKTITPSTSSQTAVASGVYTTGAVTVAAIPSTYVKPTTTKTATTYTPTTSNQTIAAGTYCSGAQTIVGDANLKAENIAEGVSIFGVTGTHSGSGSGGGSVETCTVTIENISYDCYIDCVTALIVENGTYKSYAEIHDSIDNCYTITIENVVCGSEIKLLSRFNAGYGIEPYTEINGTASFNSWGWLDNIETRLMTMAFTAPSTPNEYCTIGFMGNV